MSYKSKQATRIAADRCDYTCPAVDSIFDSLLGDIVSLLESNGASASDTHHARHLIENAQKAVKKNGTERLREALIGIAGDLIDAEETIDELRSQLRDVA